MLCLVTDTYPSFFSHTPFGIKLVIIDINYHFWISTTMKTRIMCYILIASILLSSLVSVTAKPLSLFGASTQQALFKHSATVVDPTTKIQDVSRHAFDPTQGNERILRAKGNGYKKALRGLTRLGSTPPRCEHKCGGCIPCDPIQIPTNNHLLGVQYANYEPEGWKCKCRNSYFNP